MPRITAIVTVYYPNEKHLANIYKIAEQVDRIIVSDNSSFNNKYIFRKFSNLYYFFWNKNLGLSASFNKILKNTNLNWDNNDFVIFFDQDTTIPLNHINSLIKDYESLVSKGYDVGCIGPVYFNKSMGKKEIPKLRKCISKSIIKVKNIITTSMLCNYSKLKSINFWNEEIFLDLADFDLCWRFNDRNIHCFMSYNSVIYHNVGEGKRKILFFNIRIAKPFREYYQTRDCLYLIKKDYVPWMMKLRFILNLTLRPLLHFIFLDSSKARMKFVLKGYSDYFKNIHGELFDKKGVI